MSRQKTKRSLFTAALILLTLGVVVGVAVAIVLTTRHAPRVVPVPIPGAAGSPGSAAWGVDAYSAPPGAITRLEQAMGRQFEAFSVYEGLDASAQYPNAAAHE